MLMAACMRDCAFGLPFCRETAGLSGQKVPVDAVVRDAIFCVSLRFPLVSPAQLKYLNKQDPHQKRMIRNLK